MIAYVLIQTESLGVPVAERVREIPGVVSADDINGPYDAIAVARSDSSTALIEGVVEPIRRLDGVQRALVAPLSDGAAERLRGDRAA
ncbi:MAG TPA: Lrp/AsnC ligand binding domain-containing protein [Actinomycetota bacterium]|jgi:DNA-binding Lrp family transcriptional regulator|nr:Lrp/AsnC ligand binding domain-containing protein [Actinomycetota bacterium]